MIILHRLGSEGNAFALNCDLILTIESTPDTVIHLVTGGRMVVRESLPEVVELIAQWRATIAHRGLHAEALKQQLPVQPGDDDPAAPGRLRPV